jgi:cyclophilin family peptidyl-prolyl cis-trans isomerase
MPSLIRTLPPLLAAFLLTTAGCNERLGGEATTPPGNLPSEPAAGAPPAPGEGGGETPAPGEGAAPVKVTMTTSKGVIELELNPGKAPKTVANFVAYAKKGHYDGTLFHRVISDFMIQGGGFDAKMAEKPTDAPIPNEGQNGLKNLRGTIAMARTGDPDSATSQFFINVKDNSQLDYPSPDGFGYAVFGKVTAGMDVVDAIRNTPTGIKPDANGRPMEDVPTTAVTIKSVKVAAAEETP